MNWYSPYIRKLRASDHTQGRAIVFVPPYDLHNFEQLYSVLKAADLEIFIYSTSGTISKAELARLNKILPYFTAILYGKDLLVPSEQIVRLAGEHRLPILGFSIDTDAGDEWEDIKHYFDDDADDVIRALKNEIKLNDSKKVRLFLSYSKLDIVAVRSIYTAIRRRYDVWVDFSELHGGVEWESIIEDRLDTSDRVLVFLSKNGLAKKGYFNYELKLLERIHSLFPAGYRYLIPIRLDDCEVPRFMRRFHYIDCFDRDLNEFIKTLSKALER